jgi:hypothetical protein
MKIDKDTLQEFPSRRIKPVDGLAVTADVWREAHDYHRQRQRFHNLLSHGPGIVSGLDVIASDPPDTTVYVQPGVAVDSQGREIVLKEPITYDIGSTSEGWLYLLLSYGESDFQPQSGEDATPESPRYVHTEFGIETQPQRSASEGIELARIRRQERDSLIFNAQDVAHPGANEIDLRFRREVGAEQREALAMAVCYVGGGMKSARHSEGANYMARAFGRCSRPGGVYQLHVDHDIPLTPGLEVYTLVYVVGQGSFQLGKEEMEALYAYIERGGTLLIESCRHETDGGAQSGAQSSGPQSDTAFYNLLSDLGVELSELRSDHRLLREPFLFAAPPPGFETQGSPRVVISDGVIFSTHDYGCLWQGERRGGSAAREEIRSAMEWGSNVVAYALARRKRIRGE